MLYEKETVYKSDGYSGKQSTTVIIVQDVNGGEYHQSISVTTEEPIVEIIVVKEKE